MLLFLEAMFKILPIAVATVDQFSLEKQRKTLFLCLWGALLAHLPVMDCAFGIPSL